MRSTLDQIRTALASAYPLTVLVSLEEERMQRLLEQFASGARPQALPVSVWNCVDGFGTKAEPRLSDPMKAMAWVASDDAPKGFYLFKDLEDLLEDRKVLRRLRDTAMGVRHTGRDLFLYDHLQ